MALRVKATSTSRIKSLTILTAVFALSAQPLVPLNIPTALATGIEAAQETEVATEVTTETQETTPNEELNLGSKAEGDIADVTTSGIDMTTNVIELAKPAASLLELANSKKDTKQSAETTAKNSFATTSNDADSKTIHVAESENLQKAIDNANSGDTIIIGEGTFYTGLKIDKSLTIEGAGQDSTTIKAPMASASKGSLISISGEGVSVTISNLSVDGFGYSYSAGHAAVHAHSNANLNISNVTIKNATHKTKMTKPYVYAILIGDDESSSTTATANISNVNIDNYHRGGIYVSGPNSFANIIDNEITAPTDPHGLTNGIVVQYGANAFIDNNGIVGNKYTGNYSGGGISLWDNTSGETVVTANNRISNNDVGIGVITDGPAALANLNVEGATGNNYDAVAYPVNPYGFYPDWAPAPASDIIRRDISTYAKNQVVMVDGKARVVGYDLLQDSPVIKSLTPSNQGFIKGKSQKVYVNFENPGAVRGGFLQLNKALEDDTPPLNKDRINHKLLQDSKGKWYAEIDTTDLNDGKYLYKVEAHGTTTPWGYYGNTSAWRASNYYFTVDNTQPEIVEKITPSDNSYVGDKLSLKFKVEDSTSGIRNVNIHIFEDGKTAHIVKLEQTEEENIWAAIDYDISMLKDGRYSFVSRATDNAGNTRVGPGTNHGSVIKDTTAPTIEVKSNTTDRKFTTTLDKKHYSLISFRLQDANIIDKYTINDKEFEVNHNQRHVNFLKDGVRNAKEGKNTLTVTDIAGNSSEVEFILDHTTPEVIIDAPTITNDENQIITGLVSESETSGVGRNWFEIKHPTDGLFYVNGKDNFKLSEAYTESNGSKKFLNVDDGKYRIRYVATDNAGNRSDTGDDGKPYANPTYHFITLDTTKPDVTISNETTISKDGVSYFKTARNVQVDIPGEANLGNTAIYRSSDNTPVLTNNTYSERSFKLGSGLPEGEYYIVHTDLAENKSDKIHFTIANTNPTITDIQYSNIVGQKGSTIRFNVNQNGGVGLDRLVYRINEFDGNEANNRGKQVVGTTELDPTSRQIDLAKHIENLQDNKTYVVLMQVRNEAHAHGTEYVEFTVDKLVPTVEVNEFQFNATSPVVISGTANSRNGIRHNALNTSDGSPHVKLTFYSLDENGNNASAITKGLIANVNHDGAWTFNRQGTARELFTSSGKYRLTVTAYDKAGSSYSEAGKTQEVINFTVDIDAPTITNGVFDPESNTLTFIVEDEDTESVEIKIDETEAALSAVKSDNSNVWTVDLSDLNPGIYHYTATATDGSGNIGSTTSGESNPTFFEIKAPTGPENEGKDEPETPAVDDEDGTSKPGEPGSTEGNTDGNGNQNNGDGSRNTDSDSQETTTTQTVAAAVQNLGVPTLLLPANTFFATAPIAEADTADEDSTEDSDVLGATTQNNSTGNDDEGEVLGATTEESAGPWTVLGMAWYWWIIIVSALIGAMAVIAALRRDPAEERI